MEWVWFVVAGLVLAILTPPFKRLYTWMVETFAAAQAESHAQRIAPHLIVHLNGKLGLGHMREDIEYIKKELTINGGVTVKDRIHSIERQLEQIITDR